MKKLSKYLSKKKLSQQKFAEMIGVTQAAVNRYVNGVQKPEENIMVKIFEITKGEVTPNDFYGIKSE